MAAKILFEEVELLVAKHVSFSAMKKATVARARELNAEEKRLKEELRYGAPGFVRHSELMQELDECQCKRDIEFKMIMDITKLVKKTKKEAVEKMKLAKELLESEEGIGSSRCPCSVPVSTYMSIVSIFLMEKWVGMKKAAWPMLNVPFDDFVEISTFAVTYNIVVAFPNDVYPPDLAPEGPEPEIETSQKESFVFPLDPGQNTLIHN